MLQWQPSAIAGVALACSCPPEQDNTNKGVYATAGHQPAAALEALRGEAPVADVDNGRVSWSTTCNFSASAGCCRVRFTKHPAFSSCNLDPTLRTHKSHVHCLTVIIRKVLGDIVPDVILFFLNMVLDELLQNFRGRLVLG